jgi:hypothetical protein
MTSALASPFARHARIAALVALSSCCESGWADESRATTRPAAQTTTSKVVATHSKRPPANFCVTISTPECRVMLTAVLGASGQRSASFRQPLPAYDAEVGADLPALRFHKRAYWVRRLETIGREGIAFARVPQGRNSEVVIGITRKGRLGFTVVQKGDNAR